MHSFRPNCAKGYTQTAQSIHFGSSLGPLKWSLEATSRLLVVGLILSIWTGPSLAMDRVTRESLRSQTVELFYHGYDNYLRYAFPEDELRPLTCGPLTRDRENPAHIELNDVLGNYSLTLIDSLSSLAILASSSSGSKRNKPLQLFQNGGSDLVSQYGD